MRSTLNPPDEPSPASLVFFMVGVSIHDTVTVVCPCLSLQYFRQPLAFGVGVVPKVEEEEQENQAVQANDVDKDGELVGAVLHEEILGDVACHHYKLDLGSNKGKKGQLLPCYTIRLRRDTKREQQSCQATQLTS